MGAQGLVRYLCLFGNRLRIWLLGHSALNTIGDGEYNRTGVIQEGALEGWNMKRWPDFAQVCEI